MKRKLEKETDNSEHSKEKRVRKNLKDNPRPIATPAVKKVGL